MARGEGLDHAERQAKQHVFVSDIRVKGESYGIDNIFGKPLLRHGVLYNVTAIYLFTS